MNKLVNRNNLPRPRTETEPLRHRITGTIAALCLVAACSPSSSHQKPVDPSLRDMLEQRVSATSTYTLSPLADVIDVFPCSDARLIDYCDYVAIFGDPLRPSIGAVSGSLIFALDCKDGKLTADPHSSDVDINSRAHQTFDEMSTFVVTSSACKDGVLGGGEARQIVNELYRAPITA